MREDSRGVQSWHAQGKAGQGSPDYLIGNHWNPRQNPSRFHFNPPDFLKRAAFGRRPEVLLIRELQGNQTSLRPGPRQRLDRRAFNDSRSL